MIRTGIYKINQFDKVALKDVFGKEKNISIYLYNQVYKIHNPDQKTYFAELILNRFNSDRNVIKRTYKNRFDNFDKISINEISKLNYATISIFDIAISDGRASYYFLEQSAKQLHKFFYTCSDIHINYYVNKKRANCDSYIITDENKKIVEITRPPFVWNLSRTEGRFYFINNFLKSLHLKKAYKALKNNKFTYQEKIELIHPDFRTLLAKDQCFQIRNYNLFDKMPGTYNIIRAMNILHPGYFTNDQLSLILNNLYNGLEKNGLFIEGSNENEGTPVEGAIYKKGDQGFMIISQPEKPSRIKELILSFRCFNQNEQ